MEYACFHLLYFLQFGFLFSRGSIIHFAALELYVEIQLGDLPLSMIVYPLGALYVGCQASTWPFF